MPFFWPRAAAADKGSQGKSLELIQYDTATGKFEVGKGTNKTHTPTTNTTGCFVL